MKNIDIDWLSAARALNERLTRKGWKRTVSVGGSDWGLRIAGDAHGLELLCADGRQRYFGGPFISVSASTPDGQFLVGYRSWDKISLIRY